jgi:hypothetical protein
MKVIDLNGMRFGRLTVVGRGFNRNKRVTWRVLCDCGSVIEVASVELRIGHTRSCGCLRREVSRKNHTLHNHCSNGLSPTYRSWWALKQRCRPEYFESKWYFKKGITVCERWKKFENFLADMGERPDGMSIDRINSNGNYEPSNCRWATTHEQRINRSLLYATQKSRRANATRT